MSEEQRPWEKNRRAGGEKRCGGLRQQLLKEGFLEEVAWEPCRTGGGGLSCGNLVPTENREGLRRGARIEHRGPSRGRVGLGALLKPPYLPPASCRPPCITSPPPTASRSSSLAVGPGRLGRLPHGPVPTRPLPSLGPGPGSSQRRGQDGGLLSQHMAAPQICYLHFWGSGIQPRQAGASASRSREAAPGHRRGLWPMRRLHLEGPGSLGVVGRIRFLSSS